MSGLTRDEALAVARLALARFDLAPDSEISFVKERENIVFRVCGSTGDVALRIHRDGHRPDAEIRSENAALAALFDAGFPVPEPVPTVDGELFALIETPDGAPVQVDVQRWVADSRPLGDVSAAWSGDDAEFGPGLFRSLGDLCGRLHAAVRTLPAIAGFQRRAWDRDGLVGSAPLWGDPSRLAESAEDAEAIRSAGAAIGQTLESLGTRAPVYGLIHADLTPENVLTSPAGLTLIDFDDMGEGWLLFDLATVLFWNHRSPRIREHREAMLDAYRVHCEVPDDALAALDDLILARGLTYLGWAADRPEEDESAFLRAEVLPVVVQLCRERVGLVADGAARRASEIPTPAGAPLVEAPRAEDASVEPLLERRRRALGPHAPLFYDRPLHLVRGEGVWVWDAAGNRYLDAYNNVPQVGHANPRVADAVCRQLHTLNVNSRYLSEPVVAYAEQLLSTFDPALDRIAFTNSGSEANELAIRIARHATGRDGLLVTDHSYHGNTMALAAVTTGLMTSEPFGAHVRAIHVPDLLAGGDPDQVLASALAQVDEALASLEAAGHPIAAALFEPAFSTEGLPRVPQGYVEGLVTRVRAAGGLIIGDEVQAGLGRLGDVWWGHQAEGFLPDLVTLGKPMGNGYPLGGVVMGHALHDSFGAANEYFNTFATTPAAAAAGQGVLDVMVDGDLVARAGDLGRHVGARLEELVARHQAAGAARGRGLFFGLSLVDADGNPDGARAKRLVERLREDGVIISRIGPHGNVLKIRPPLIIEQPELDAVIDAVDRALGELE